jgi:hypothetical protein
MMHTQRYFRQTIYFIVWSFTVSVLMKIFLHFRQDGENMFLRKIVIIYQIIRYHNPENPYLNLITMKMSNFYMHLKFILH